MEPIETITIKEKQSFELYDHINPIQITIDDDRIVNILKKHANVYYKLTPMGILFPASIKNNSEQIFVTSRELNNAKPVLINGKLENLLATIKLNKINSLEHIKGKSLRVNVNFDSLEELKRNRSFLFFIQNSFSECFVVVQYLFN